MDLFKYVTEDIFKKKAEEREELREKQKEEEKEKAEEELKKYGVSSVNYSKKNMLKSTVDVMFTCSVVASAVFAIYVGINHHGLMQVIGF